MAERLTLNLTVNGRERTLDVAVHHTLLEVLRDEVDLTGTKECCVVGECGACTVLVDGRSVNSCLMLAVEAEGSEVLTVEGLAVDGELDPLQTAFLDQSAAQCGFCIPGQLMSATALLERTDRSHRRADPGGAGGQPLSLCGLRADLQGRAPGGATEAGPSRRAGAMTSRAEDRRLAPSRGWLRACHRSPGVPRRHPLRERAPHQARDRPLRARTHREHRHERRGGRARRGAGGDRCRPAAAGATLWAAVPGSSRPGGG